VDQQQGLKAVKRHEAEKIPAMPEKKKNSCSATHKIYKAIPATGCEDP
jgi:hypothetical protein